MTGAKKGMPRGEVLRRAAGVVAGLIAFGSVGVVAVPAAASQMSVRSSAMQYFTWKAGTPAVAVTLDDPVDSVDTVVVGRERAPQVFITRTCLVGGPIRVEAETAEDGRTPGVHVAGTPRWNACHTRLTWQIPSQTSTLTVAPQMYWPAQSRDEEEESEASGDVASDAQRLAEWNARREQVEKVLAGSGLTDRARADAQAELDALRTSIEQGTSDLKASKERLADVRKAHADSLAAAS